MCSSRRVTICQEWGEYASTGTATHELGHNLGSFHDGQNNSCSSAWQYIMATAPTLLTADDLLHPFEFSGCSISYFTSYLRTLDIQKTNCLLNSSTAIDPNLVDELTALPPGQFLTVDRQCQLIYGPTSFYCGGAINDAQMCRQMFCYDTTAHTCLTRAEQRAANGTTCGNGKWCMKGSCIEDPMAPAASDECLSGDSRVPFDDGSTCARKISAETGLCYQEYYNQTCCETCALVRQLNSPDCPYGDRSQTYCTNQLATRDCYDDTTRADCCATCEQSRRNVAGCEYGDRAGWCPTIDGSLCYTSSYRQTTCCYSCWLLTAYGYPGCEYGDKESWCKSATADACSQQHTYNDTCCLTCHPEHKKPISIDCKDSASWCSNIPASYCYATDKTCCRTCAAYNLHLPGCEYGDRYDWCNTTLELSDCKNNVTLDDCCYTCFRLMGITRTTVKPKNGVSTPSFRRSSPGGLAVALFVSLAFAARHPTGVVPTGTAGLRTS
jgi:hypothetical protein